MSELENKSKKNRTGYLTSPANVNAANHLSYLFQTAHTVLLTTADLNLVRHLVKQIHVHAQKKQIRLHPEMKRLLCPCCNMILWSPLTATIRFNKHKTGILVTCSTCGRSRSYPKHNSWPTEYGAHVPSDWLFNSFSSMGKFDSQFRFLKYKAPSKLPRAIIAPNYRLNQFQFRQALPARLRDYVRGGGTTASEYTCGPLMNIMLTCLQKHEYDNFGCEKEVADFYACVNEFQETSTVEKANLKGGGDPDKVVKQFAKNRQPAWLSNKLLKTYPTSSSVE
ncbi:hypothetical protein I4U23_002112 [Adineta vaga]|nr:hypothetical protein I4U23_002112 [Adineta vaga]